MGGAFRKRVQGAAVREPCWVLFASASTEAVSVP